MGCCFPGVGACDRRPVESADPERGSRRLGQGEGNEEGKVGSLRWRGGQGRRRGWDPKCPRRMCVSLGPGGVERTSGHPSPLCRFRWSPGWFSGVLRSSRRAILDLPRGHFRTILGSAGDWKWNPHRFRGDVRTKQCVAAIRNSFRCDLRVQKNV